MPDELENLETQLIAYLDGELSPADALTLEQKLAEYPQHRNLLDELRQQRELLRSLPPETAPNALKAQMSTQMAQARASGLSHRRLYRIAASVLLMLGAGIVVHQLLPQRGAEAPQFASRMEAPASAAMKLSETDALAREDEHFELKLDARSNDPVPGVALAQVQPRQMFVNSSAGRTIINVATDNPTVLQAEIGRLLRDNRIAFSQEAQVPAEVQTAGEGVLAREGLGLDYGPSGKPSAGPLAADARDERAAGDRLSAKFKDAEPPISSKVIAQPADKNLNQELAKREKERNFVLGDKQASAKPAAPTTPTVVAAPAPIAAVPVTHPGAVQTNARQSLSQQVLVARNVSSGDVAQIEQALRDRQVAQKVKYRVTDTSNSQMAAPTPMIGAVSRRTVVTTTHPALLPSTTSPAQARGGARTPTAFPATQQSAPEQGEQTMDLLIVVEPESK